MFIIFKRTLLIAVLSIFAIKVVSASTFSHNVSFIRMQTRDAALGSIDAAYYNPVGLASMKDGFSIDLGNQIMTKMVSDRVVRTNGEVNVTSGFIPNVAAVLKKGKGALFFSLFMPAGLETQDFRKPAGGMPLVGYLSLNLDPYQMDVLTRAGLTARAGSLELPIVDSIKTSQYWLQWRLGGSFSIVDGLAVSGGIVGSYYNYEQSAGIADVGTVHKLKKKALGWSGFFGLMIAPSKNAALTAMYSTQVIARGTDQNIKYFYSHVMEQRMPDYLAVGLNIKAADKSSIQISYQIDFTGEKTYGTKNILTRDHELGYLDWAYIVKNAASLAVLPFINGGNTQNYKHKNRHRIGIGVELEIGPVQPSIGLSFMTQEKYPRSQNPIDPDLARVGFGTGIKADVGKNVIIETGTAYYFYITDRMLYNSIKLNKLEWSFGLGLTYKGI